MAFEISPLLTASGSFGDKSGVFRYIYGFLTTLIKELKQRDSRVKIFLFTFAPHNLNYSVSPELIELAKDKNVSILGYQKDLKTTIPYYKKIFDLIEIRPIKKILKILDSLFSLRKTYASYIDKRNFRSYVKSLEKEFYKQNIEIVFHSETGFFPLRHLINIITIYDLTTIIFPELHRVETVDLHLRKIRFAKNSAQMILAISESTKKDLYTHSEAFRQKPIVVAYPGLDANFVHDISKIKLVQGLHSPLSTKRYLLYYGTFEPRKNITYAVRAFTELYNEGQIPSDYKFVLIGGKGWGKTKENILGYISENFPVAATRPIIVLDYTTDQNLRSYIKHARAVIYPSLYEGFGLPILESMSLGTPVLTSTTSSMPEVGGTAAIYVNPKNYFDLKDKIKLVITDDKLVGQMIKKGLQQSKKFTWESTVSRVLDALEFDTLKPY